MDELSRLETEMSARGFGSKTKKFYYLSFLKKKRHNITLNLIISTMKFSFEVFGSSVEIKRLKKEKHLPFQKKRLTK